DGRIESVFDSKHAISMVCSNGAELLMHIGMDTVQLEGKGFAPQVKNGDAVKKGQLLMKFNLDEIKAAGYDVATPIVVTNGEKFAVQPVAEGTVAPGAALMKLEATV
uniref:PTS sugar transporter subunit IIA n=1 Tax=uncultured Subdoligranulum sp. TaxID=512298 RepID=UPI0025E9837B